MASFRPETFTKIWNLGPKFAACRSGETLGTAAKPRKCRRFPTKPETYTRDRTGWLGREDSNLRMAESKSAWKSLFSGLHFEKYLQNRPPNINRLAPVSKCRSPVAGPQKRALAITGPELKRAPQTLALRLGRIEFRLAATNRAAGSNPGLAAATLIDSHRSSLRFL